MNKLSLSCKLRTKLLAIPIITLLVAFSLSAILISKRVNMALLENEEKQIAQNSRMLSEIYNNNTAVMTDTMKMTVVQQALYDGYFGALTEDFDFLKDFLGQTMNLAKVDEVFVVGKDQKIVLRATSDERGESVSYGDLLQPVLSHPAISDKNAQLDEVVSTQLVIDGEMVKLISIGPILDIETIVGCIVFVKLLDKEFLVNQTPYFDNSVELSIANENKILATTLPGFSLIEELKEGTNAFSSEINARPFRHAFTPLKGGQAFIGLSFDVSENKTARNFILKLLAGILLVSIGITVFIIMFNVNKVIGRIKNLTLMLKDIAEGDGDLTSRLEANNHDEVGELAQWFNKFIENLQKMIGGVSLKADVLNTSALDLSKLSGQMSSGVEGMSNQSASVAAAAEEMSSNMDAVTSAVEQANTNIGMVSAAAEQMSATIGEIARNSNRANDITNNAVSEAKEASDKVDDLGQAAKAIGSVTQTITEISEQTNLLALNATIEAARAGEAGKGFAVVANEIKELARQTADATSEIRNEIGGIQGSIEGTVEQIRQITGVIDDVNEIVSTIATAVEEQSVTTKEIAGNVGQASKGIQEVTQNVDQSATVSTEIAKDISKVDETAAEVASNSSHVNGSAEKLSNVAEELKTMVGRFKI